MRGYTLPPGNVQVSFSGGRSSAYMLHQILAVNGDLPDRAQVIFANTGREMPETLDFVQECGDRWGVKIVWVEDAKRGGGALFDVVSHNSASRDGEPFARLLARKKACPDQSKRFCTEHLKILPARRYLMSLGWREWTNAIGFRADEPSRKVPSRDKRICRWYPLEDVTSQDVLEFWRRQPFDLRVAPGYGNCDGCFMKSEAQLAALARDHPDRAAWWERAEVSVGGRFRDQFTRAQLRQTVERQGDFLFSVEDGFCQRRLGECS